MPSDNYNDNQQLYASPSVMATFPWLDMAVSHLPDSTKVLVINRSDIEPDSLSKIYNLNDYMDRNALTSKQDIDFKVGFEYAQNRLMHLMTREDLSSQSSFIPKSIISQTFINDHVTMYQITHATTVKAFAQKYAAVRFDTFIDMSIDACLVTVPNSKEAPIKAAQAMSSLPYNLINGITGNATDWAIFSIGHEIGGHCSKGNISFDKNDLYSLVEINMQSADKVLVSETKGDIAGYELYREMQKAGIASDADVPTQVQHLRALSNFANNGNAYNIYKNENIGAHTTTIGYDTSKEGAISEFNIASMAHISSLPIIINTYSDAIIGLYYAQSIKQLINTGNSPDLNEDSMLMYDMLTDDPNKMHTQLNYFAQIGRNVRANNHEWQYAAIRYLYEENGFDDLKKRIKPEYAKAVDDLLEDYLRAVDKHAIAIKDDNNVKRIRFAMRDSLDFPKITQRILEDNDYTAAYVLPASNDAMYDNEGSKKHMQLHAPLM